MNKDFVLKLNIDFEVDKLNEIKIFASNYSILNENKQEVNLIDFPDLNDLLIEYINQRKGSLWFGKNK